MKFVKRLILVVVLISAVTGVSVAVIFSYIKSHSIDVVVRLMDEHPEYQQAFCDMLDVQADNIRDLTVNLPEEDKAVIKDIIDRNMVKVKDAMSDDDLKTAIKEKDMETIKSRAKTIFPKEDYETLKEIYKNRIEEIKEK